MIIQIPNGNHIKIRHPSYYRHTQILIGVCTWKGANPARIHRIHDLYSKFSSEHQKLVKIIYLDPPIGISDINIFPEPLIETKLKNFTGDHSLNQHNSHLIQRTVALMKYFLEYTNIPWLFRSLDDTYFNSKSVHSMLKTLEQYNTMTDNVVSGFCVPISGRSYYQGASLIFSRKSVQMMTPSFGSILDKMDESEDRYLAKYYPTDVFSHYSTLQTIAHGFAFNPRYSTWNNMPSLPSSLSDISECPATNPHNNAPCPSLIGRLNEVFSIHSFSIYSIQHREEQFAFVQQAPDWIHVYNKHADSVLCIQHGYKPTPNDTLAFEQLLTMSRSS